MLLDCDSISILFSIALKCKEYSLFLTIILFIHTCICMLFVPLCYGLDQKSVIQHNNNMYIISMKV